MDSLVYTINVGKGHAWRLGSMLRKAHGKLCAHSNRVFQNQKLKNNKNKRVVKYSLNRKLYVF